MSNAFVKLLLGVAATSGFSATALAASVADVATSRYIVQCGSSATPGAVYECALAAAVQARAIAGDVAQGCEADVAATVASTQASRQKWQCARLRQFGSQMPYDEWHKETMGDCYARSARAGHRYQGQPQQCVVDSMVEQKRATASQVETCHQTARAALIQVVHNCLHQALKQPAGEAVPARSPSPVERSEANRLAASQGPSPNSHAQCQAYLQQNPMPSPMREIFMGNCPGSKSPPAVMAATAGKTHAAAAAGVQQDNADLSPEKVRASIRTWCESYNVTGAIRYDCACLVREADGHLKQDRLPFKSIAEQQFDTSPCVDRVRSAERIVAANFTEGSRRAMEGAGVDVDAMKACLRRAIETQIDANDLLNFGSLGAQLRHLCPAKIKR